MFKEFLKKHIDYNKLCVNRVLRAAKIYKKGGLYKIIALFMHKKNRRKFNIEIYPQVDIGKIIIPHAVGIVIGKTASIGDGTVIMPNVVVGARFSPTVENPKKRRHAIIGKNCILGANSVIIGDITIGNNVTIGAGAIVTKDVPDNSVVVGHNIVKVKSKNEVNYYDR